jgi:TrmH family RNA methyltransferase
MSSSIDTPAFGDIISLNGPELVVVLVEAADPRNIGAVARAMSNLAVSSLRLVNVAKFDQTVAQGVACWGKDLVVSAQRFDSLRDAVADCHEVVGFASDSAGHRVPQLLLGEWVSQVSERAGAKVALVFGSEENGLRREHFPLCQYLVRIPSSTANPSYNLAQSVILALYAIRATAQSHVGASQPDWPVSSQLEPLTDMVLEVAKDVGFLNQNSPEQIRELLVNLTRRGRVNKRELLVLTGLVGMIKKRIAAPRDIDKH